MSKFLDDLQRWTEAQVAAILRGRIGAKRKDYLAADINKLLRDRINEPLAIKVGDKILAEFLRNRRPPGPWKIPSDYYVGMWEGKNEDPIGDGFYNRVAELNLINGQVVWNTEHTDNLNALSFKIGVTPGYPVQGYYVSETERRPYLSCSGGAEDNWRYPIDAYAMEHTGEMRKVVQYLLGKNVPVIYNHCPERTHGIFTGTDNSKWVIEISTEDGITAWRLPKKVGNVPGLGYTPKPVTTFPYLNQRILLLDAAGISDYALKQTCISPSGNALGWAFNSTGTKARHTRLNSVDDSYKTWLYEVTITGSDEPVSASIALLDSDYYWTPSHSRFHAKIPFSGNRYTLWPSAPSYTEHPPGTEFRAPIFTFFDDDDVPVTVYYHHKDDETETVSAPDDMPLHQATKPSEFGTYEYGTSIIYGINRFEIEGMEKLSPYLGHDGKASRSLTTKVLAQTGGDSGDFMHSGGIYHQYYEHTSAVNTNTILRGGWAQVLLIPMGNRTAFYLAENQSGSGDVDSWTVSTTTTYHRGAWGLHEIGGLFRGPQTYCGGESGGRIYVSSYDTTTFTTFASYLTTPCSYAGIYGVPPNEYHLWCVTGASLDPMPAGSYVTESIIEGPTPARIRLEYYSADTAQNRVLIDEPEYYPLDDDTGLFWFMENAFELWNDGVMVNQLDAFTGKGRISNTANPDQGGGYTYIGNPQEKWPIDEVQVIHVGWFGVPFQD